MSCGRGISISNISLYRLTSPYIAKQLLPNIAKSLFKSTESIENTESTKSTESTESTESTVFDFFLINVFDRFHRIDRF